MPRIVIREKLFRRIEGEKLVDFRTCILINVAFEAVQG